MGERLASCDTRGELFVAYRIGACRESAEIDFDDDGISITCH
jgi:hypothetical protein